MSLESQRFAVMQKRMARGVVYRSVDAWLKGGRMKGEKKHRISWRLREREGNGGERRLAEATA